MNNYSFKTIFAAVIIMFAAFFTNNISAKPQPVPRMYVFGFAASFRDTIVHFTNVMEVDSAWIESKSKFLLGRSAYSHQLRDYLGTAHSMPMRTCIVMYDKDRAKLEKKLLKMKKTYSKGKDGKPHFDVRFLEDSEFRFRTVNWGEVLQQMQEDEKATADARQANASKNLVKQQK